MSTFGQRLREARKSMRLSQMAAAKRVRMQQPLLSELENDKYETSGFTPRLAHLYKVNARWLADGVGPREVSDAEALEDAEVVGLWTQYSQADVATKAMLEYLLAGKKPEWMSEALADAIGNLRRMVAEQAGDIKK